MFKRGELQDQVLTVLKAMGGERITAPEVATLTVQGRAPTTREQDSVAKSLSFLFSKGRIFRTRKTTATPGNHSQFVYWTRGRGVLAGVPAGAPRREAALQMAHEAWSEAAKSPEMKEKLRKRVAVARTIRQAQQAEARGDTARSAALHSQAVEMQRLLHEAQIKRTAEAPVTKSAAKPPAKRPHDGPWYKAKAEAVARAIARVQNGESVSDAAKAEGVHYTTVYDAMHRHKLATPGTGRIPSGKHKHALGETKVVWPRPPEKKEPVIKPGPQLDRRPPAPASAAEFKLGGKLSKDEAKALDLANKYTLDTPYATIYVIPKK